MTEIEYQQAAEALARTRLDGLNTDVIQLASHGEINFLATPVAITFYPATGPEMREELAELLQSQTWIEIMRWDFGIPEKNIRRFRYGLKRLEFRRKLWKYMN